MNLTAAPTRIRGGVANMRAQLRRIAFSYLNSGDAVICGLCGWKGRRFLNSTCPKCNSLPRHRLIPYAVRRFDLSFSEKVLLHFGANGNETRWMASAFQPRLYARADICVRPITNIVFDARHIPFADESVDAIIAWHVLEHITDDKRVVREMQRVLKKGGFCLISVPIYPPGRLATYEDERIPRERFEEVYGHHDHVRACGLDYVTRFADAGFEILELKVEDLTRGDRQSDIRRYGLSTNHVAWYCVKK